jgi:hypothetical protein
MRYGSAVFAAGATISSAGVPVYKISGIEFRYEGVVLYYHFLCLCFSVTKSLSGFNDSKLF